MYAKINRLLFYLYRFLVKTDTPREGKPVCPSNMRGSNPRSSAWQADALPTKLMLHIGARGRTRTGTVSLPRDFRTTLCHHSRIIALQSGLCLHHIISDLGGWCIVSTQFIWNNFFHDNYLFLRDNLGTTIQNSLSCY